MNLWRETRSAWQGYIGYTHQVVILKSSNEKALFEDNIQVLIHFQIKVFMVYRIGVVYSLNFWLRVLSGFLQFAWQLGENRQRLWRGEWFSGIGSSCFGHNSFLWWLIIYLYVSVQSLNWKRIVKNSSKGVVLLKFSSLSQIKWYKIKMKYARRLQEKKHVHKCYRVFNSVFPLKDTWEVDVHFIHLCNHDTGGVYRAHRWEWGKTVPKRSVECQLSGTRS